MAKCAYCGSTVVFGGKRDGDLRFCNDSCHQKGALLVLGQQVPDEVVRDCVRQVHLGSCPICRGRGPVDVHTSYRVWSALLLTSWSSRPQISCRTCGIKNKLVDTLFSLVLGWWGFPWGLIFTPIQITRNVIGIFVSVIPDAPSQQLEMMLRLNLAAQVVVAHQNRSGPGPPPLPLPPSGDSKTTVPHQARLAESEPRPGVPKPPALVAVKIQCACGQRYAFDVEPVNGRLPAPVHCPKCGADGTAAADQIIAQTLGAGAVRPA